MFTHVPAALPHDLPCPALPYPTLPYVMPCSPVPAAATRPPLGRLPRRTRAKIGTRSERKGGWTGRRTSGHCGCRSGCPRRSGRGSRCSTAPSTCLSKSLTHSPGRVTSIASTSNSHNRPALSTCSSTSFTNLYRHLSQTHPFVHPLPPSLLAISTSQIHRQR